jgi:hypothetical protein
MKTRNELVNSGPASPHHALPPHSGWVSYWIENGDEEDVAAMVGLFRLRYEQLRPRSLAKNEEKVEEAFKSIKLKSHCPANTLQYKGPCYHASTK